MPLRVRSLSGLDTLAFEEGKRAGTGRLAEELECKLSPVARISKLRFIYFADLTPIRDR